MSKCIFFIYTGNINISLKKNSYIIFENSFNFEYIDIQLVIKVKVDNDLRKNFNINLRKYNEIR